MSRHRFELDADGNGSSALVDPEAYDASEERFAASLERTSPRPKFVVDGDGEPAFDAAIAKSEPSIEPTTQQDQQASPSSEVNRQASLAAASELDTQENQLPQNVPPTAVGVDEQEIVHEPSETGIEPSEESFAAASWREEVAARLNRYRARRKPRPPRYPSLRLKFDPPDTWSTSHDASHPYPPPIVDTPVPAVHEPQALTPEAAPTPERVYTPPAETGRIIQFPRSYYGAAAPTYELAEPVMDGPRILEVPEVAPPPPALGGIILPETDPEPERRPGFDVPLQSAPMSRRVAAMAIDGLIVVAACALFVFITSRIAGEIRPSLPALETLVFVTAALWSGYQYLLLIYTGSTPGLRVARLRLSQFDGSPVPRRLRRWRVITSILSALSLGLGFAWSYLDEDALCWHDRITRTYLAPGR